MDFFQIREMSTKPNVYEISPDFKVRRSKDLMVRGRAFYAIWDEDKKMWSTDEFDVQRLVDKELFERRDSVAQGFNGSIIVKTMADFSTKSWLEYKSYLGKVPDTNIQLDDTLTFSNTKVKKSDHISKRLDYPLEPGSFDAFDEIFGTLYNPKERAKLEWSIGSIVSGDSKELQKFIVLYGEAGAGKSTVLNIIQKLFKGYCTSFDAKALTQSSNAFSTEMFRSNPLVAMQHDGDLSKIEDNTKLNSIVSHEDMTMNEKFKSSYTARTNCFLFMATNRPVKITDAKSGIIRRLIDVAPSGRLIPSNKYHALMAQIDFELGAIASHCLDVYRLMGKHYYDSYRPLNMIFQTDVFFNFVESNFDLFKADNGITLGRAYDMYKSYCEESLVDFKLPRHKFREEMKSYFEVFNDITRVDGKQIRSYYSGFLTDKFLVETNVQEPSSISLSLDHTLSLLDEECAGCPAQYASEQEIPAQGWDDVQSKLSDLDTSKIHYVRLPENHIVIDFDLKDEEGNKSAELNLEAASKWPFTYAEYSKSGCGIHLHYIYDGDVSRLSRLYSEDIEVKVFTGKSSLRRRLSKCNRIPIATINSGLPLKGDKVINVEAAKDDAHLRARILKGLRKEVHPNTKSNMDYIKKVLDDAYDTDLTYDVTDLRSDIFLFASGSTNQSDYCMKLVGQMKFKSEDVELSNRDLPSHNGYESDKLVFFDVEVFPNLFLINWKFEGPDSVCVRMINPKPKDVEELFKFKLVGFNCRRYDNHILYARYLGYTNEQIFELSQRIISGVSGALLKEAYNISYTDVFDFSSTKQSLKKFQIELGIHHKELGLPWDQPVSEDRWEEVAEYCDNDVISTEAVFNARSADWTARKILSDLAEMTVNDTTNTLTTRIIFGEDRKPQTQFNYRNLAEPVTSFDENTLELIKEYNPNFKAGNFVRPGGTYSKLPYFPGYEYKYGKSTYRDIVVGEGGCVQAVPGMHFNVALLDVASMHPTSAIVEWLFGEYTKNFADIVHARVAIKHEDLEAIRRMFQGKLAKYLDGSISLDDLSYALKIAINSVYGLTAASFDNAFRDPRNIDNIVAKRGALFMIDLMHEVQTRGFVVAHIKTDSIKIPQATPEIIEFVMDFGKKYGYEFEHEATYERMCLVNDAVYIAKYDDQGIRTKKGKKAGKWTATGAQFAHPYVFKTLFSKEPIEFKDLCETKTVKSCLYLDMNERLIDVSVYEKELDKLTKTSKENENLPNTIARINELKELISKGHDYHFVGKAGLFCPIKPEHGGGLLMRESDGKYSAATGTKDYRWLEAEAVQLLHKEDDVDIQYHRSLVDKAVAKISEWGDFEMFISDAVPPVKPKETPPWLMPCGKESQDESCYLCPQFVGGNCGYDKLPF